MVFLPLQIGAFSCRWFNSSFPSNLMASQQQSRLPAGGGKGVRDTEEAEKGDWVVSVSCSEVEEDLPNWLREGVASSDSVEVY